MEFDALLSRAARLFDQGDKDEACHLAEQALEQNPDCAMAYQILGMTYSSRLQPFQAIDLLTHALSLQPDLVPALCDLGAAYTLLGQSDSALAAFESAIRLCPDHASSHFNRAQLWLKAGRFREGWLEYEWRWRTKLVTRPTVPRPHWAGGDPQGRAILVHTEQGFGDTIQFIRMLPLLKQRGARVVFACQKPLHRLLEGIDGVDEWYPIDEEAPITFDVTVSLMSLPGMLGIDREDLIPGPLPYLCADPERVARWRKRVESLPGLKVGVNWAGKTTHARNKLRSMPLERLAPLAQEGVSLVSLHKGDGEAEIEAHRERVPMSVFSDLDADAPFVDTAALMMNLDLIVSVDTVTWHLAGALGRPVWLALSTAADWRHLDGRSDSPWYPNTRCFQQNSFGHWESVVDTMARELQREKAKVQAHVDLGQAKIMPKVPVSVGELVDKITILQIKSARIGDEGKRCNVRRELAELTRLREQYVPEDPALAELIAELKQINEQLWEIEDEIRVCERNGDFSQRFIELARSVYKTNDQRMAIKREINALLGSALVEEKSYTQNGRSGHGPRERAEARTVH